MENPISSIMALSHDAVVAFIFKNSHRVLINSFYLHVFINIPLNLYVQQANLNEPFYQRRMFILIKNYRNLIKSSAKCKNNMVFRNFMQKNYSQFTFLLKSPITNWSFQDSSNLSYDNSCDANFGDNTHNMLMIIHASLAC